MRARGVVALLGAAALLAAVLTLRGQVEPTGPVASPSSHSIPTISAPVPPLPVRESRQSPDWQTYQLQSHAMQAQADRTYLTVLQAVVGASPRPPVEIAVIRRDTGQHVISYRPEPAGWHPTRWLVHKGALLSLEESQPGEQAPPGSQPVARLMRFDLGTGAVQELRFDTVESLRSDVLQAAGDELVLVGDRDSARRTCVVAVRPGVSSRIVQCRRIGAVRFAAGSPLPVWSFAPGTPDECRRWYELTADGVTRPLPGRGGECRRADVTPIGEWRVFQQAGERAQQLLRARGPDRVLTLDDAGWPGVFCGENLYWMSGSLPWSRILNWRLGSDHTHVALEIDASQGGSLLPLQCADGVLTAQVVRTRPAPGSTQAWVLDSP